jgi:hypothetical protein
MKDLRDLIFSNMQCILNLIVWLINAAFGWLIKRRPDGAKTTITPQQEGVIEEFNKRVANASKIWGSYYTPDPSKPSWREVEDSTQALKDYFNEKGNNLTAPLQQDIELLVKAYEKAAQAEKAGEFFARLSIAGPSRSTETAASRQQARDIVNNQVPNIRKKIDIDARKMRGK